MSEKLKDTFTSARSTAAVKINRNFNISIQGTFDAVVDLQRSFDNGATWETTDTFTTPVSTIGYEVEKNVSYRFNCSSYTSGSAVVRLGGNGLGD